MIIKQFPHQRNLNIHVWNRIGTFYLANFDFDNSFMYCPPKIVSLVETWVGDSCNRQTQLPGDKFITFRESSLSVTYTMCIIPHTHYTELKEKGCIKRHDPTTRGQPSQLITGRANCHRNSKYMDPDVWRNARKFSCDGCLPVIFFKWE